MHERPPQGEAVPPIHQIRRLYVALGLVVVALILLGALILIRHDSTPQNSGSSESFSAAPGSLVSSLAQIPSSVSNSVGVTSPTYPVTAPHSVKSGAAWTVTKADGVRPVVFFYGAEFDPYAAAQRWPLIVALSRFGSFGQLGLVQSSATEVFSNLSSFTFWDSSYSSRWISLRTVERYGSVDPTGARYVGLQKPDATEASAISAFDTSPTTFPLLDIGNRFIQIGASYTPSALAGLTQAAIANDLTYPTNPITQAVETSANEITAAICSATDEKPGAVCRARGVVAADQKMGVDPTS
ncbi:MAG TPA: DUF929 family protein [Acidimicrobiales bacterium]|jgi:hypothetical protein